MTKNKITSVQTELGHAITAETAVNAIAHGFTVAFNMPVVENVQSTDGKLTREELALAEKLYKEKYTTDQWNFNGKSQTD